MCLPRETCSRLISPNYLACDKCNVAMTCCQKIWERRVQEDLVERCYGTLLRSAIRKNPAL